MSKTPFFKRLMNAIREAKKTDKKPGLTSKKIQDSSRRQFIKTSATMATIPLFGSPLVYAADRYLASQEPVVILGAGAAGLAAAYTLAKSRTPFVIFEASSRIGGRIFTQYNVNKDGQYFERGAELVDTGHVTIKELCGELELELEKFEDEIKGTDLSVEVFFFGGRSRTHQELVEGLKPFLRIVEEARAKVSNAQGGLNDSADTEKYDEMSLQQFLQQASVTVDKWILDAITVAFVGELGADPEDQSSLNLIQMIGLDAENFSMFGESDEAFRVKGGNSRLIEKLSEKILTFSPQSLKLKHELVSISERGNRLVCGFKTDGKNISVSVSRVICTIPLPVLRKVAGVNKLALSSKKMNAIKTFGYGNNTKFMLSFDDRFWRVKNAVPAHAGAIYTDLESQAFWETSRLQRGESGIITNFIGGRAAVKARKPDVEIQAAKDLGLMHQVEIKTNATILQNWNQIPTAQGSYGCLAPGQTLTIGKTLSEPELNGRLIFAGEHTSESAQGFMEGAYESGIKAAKHFLK